MVVGELPPFAKGFLAKPRIIAPPPRAWTAGSALARPCPARDRPAHRPTGPSGVPGPWFESGRDYQASQGPVEQLRDPADHHYHHEPAQSSLGPSSGLLLRWERVYACVYRLCDNLELLLDGLGRLHQFTAPMSGPIRRRRTPRAKRRPARSLTDRPRAHLGSPKSWLVCWTSVSLSRPRPSTT